MNVQNLRNHAINVATLCSEIGKHFKFSDITVMKLTIAGFLHDIGKSQIPKELLCKSGKLTSEELAQIKNHSKFGADILEELNIDDEITKAVLYHHERWDGKGYPHSLKSKQIPLFSRIIAVADTYDAMVSPRSYRNGIFSKQKALTEISSCSGTQFDPYISSNFIRMMEKNRKTFVVTFPSTFQFLTQLESPY